MMNIEELKSQIISANKAYRDGHPTMSDQMFDDLLETLEKKLTLDEYSVFRNSLHEEKGKVKHPFIMGSLDKIKAENPDDLTKFILSYVKTSLNVSAKVDGISARAQYVNGKLVSLSTRGDGEFGENLTDKMLYVKNLPKHINLKDCLDVRGELVILKDDFAQMTGFANARNACAGIMNRKEWNADDVSNVSFIAYTILGQDYSKDDQFQVLADNNFYVAWYEKYSNNVDSSFSDILVEKATQDLPYETDGLVLCDSSYRNEDKYRPNACVAFKINQLTAETRLIDVVWEGPSKDGFIIPVAILDPVELGGSTISRASLHNLDIIEKLGVKYGSRISILKSGDIIPKIVSVIENTDGCVDITSPTECSSCGYELVRDGVNMRCKNKDCGEQVVHQLTHFIKKLGVKSASNATLLNFGIISFKKLIDFVPNKKYKSEVKLYDELYSKVFSQSKSRLLTAMNFVGLSETLITKIIDHYGYDNIENNFDFDIAKKSLPMGIGEITLQKFIGGLPDALRNVNNIINDVRWHYTQDDFGKSNAIDIKGSICVTGSLKFGSRNKFLEFAKEHGYESKSGVSKGLTYLINNDVTSNSSKNKKAKELGIKILSEDEFIKLINTDKYETSVFDL